MCRAAGASCRAVHLFRCILAFLTWGWEMRVVYYPGLSQLWAVITYNPGGPYYSGRPELAVACLCTFLTPHSVETSLALPGENMHHPYVPETAADWAHYIKNTTPWSKKHLQAQRERKRRTMPQQTLFLLIKANKTLNPRMYTELGNTEQRVLKTSPPAHFGEWNRSQWPSKT